MATAASWLSKNLDECMAWAACGDCIAPNRSSGSVGDHRVPQEGETHDSVGEPLARDVRSRERDLFRKDITYY